MTVTPDTLGRLTLLAVTSADIFASPSPVIEASTGMGSEGDDNTASAAAVAATAPGVRELTAVSGTGAAAPRAYQPLLQDDTAAVARLLRKCDIAITVHLGMAVNLQYDDSGMTMSLELANQVRIRTRRTRRTSQARQDSRQYPRAGAQIIAISLTCPLSHYQFRSWYTHQDLQKQT